MQKAAYCTLRYPVASSTAGRRVLVVIPYRDNWALTQLALESLFAQKLGCIQLMVALVDNGSIEQATRAGTVGFVQRSTSTVMFRHLRYDFPFNYSRLNNQAVADCADFAPDHLLFLNNDVELIEPATITKLNDFLAGNPQCGSVGCTLLYPDRKIQHLFFFPGCKLGASHPFRGLPFRPDDPWVRSPRPVGGCTAALLLVRHADFVAVGGFAEELAQSAQDIDLALKLQQHGRINWTIPDVVAIHRESQSRNPAIRWDEVSWLIDHWQDYLFENPFVSPRLCRWSERLVLTLGEGRYPWHAIVPTPRPRESKAYI